MNSYRRRSAIVAVALVATMGAGAALAADTGLPPGFLKTSLTTSSARDATVANTLARQSLGAGILTSTAYDSAKLSSTLAGGGMATVAQALRRSDDAGVVAGIGYMSTLRDAMTDEGLASAGFSANRSDSTLADLASLAQGLTSGTGVGTETLTYSGFGTSRPSYAGRGRLSDVSRLLSSARADGSSAIDLTRLADALTDSDSAGRRTFAYSGLPTGRSAYRPGGRIDSSTAFASSSLSTGQTSYSAGRSRGITADNATYATASARETASVDLARLAEALAEESPKQTTLSADISGYADSLRAAHSITFSKEVFSADLTRSARVDLLGLAEALVGDSSERASFTTGFANSDYASSLRAAGARGSAGNEPLSAGRFDVSLGNIAGLARALTGGN